MWYPFFILSERPYCGNVGKPDFLRTLCSSQDIYVKNVLFYEKSAKLQSVSLSYCIK